MAVIHGSWLIEIERIRGRAILRLFCYDFTAVAPLNNQPGVVGVNAGPVSKPAETGIRNEFVHAVTNGKCKVFHLNWLFGQADPHRHSLFEHRSNWSTKLASLSHLPDWTKLLWLEH